MKSPQPSHSASALGRTIDFEYPSNVVAVFGSLATATLFGSYNILASAPLQTSWGAAGMGAFLAWAIARELDPDNTRSAAIAIAVSTVVSLVATPSLLTALGILLGVRLLTGSVDVSMGRLDPILLVGLGALLGAGRTTPAAIPVLLAGIVVFGDRSRRSILVAAAAAGAAVATLILTQPLVTWHRPDAWTVAFLVATVGVAVLIIPAPEPVSQTDFGEQRLVGWRVSAARGAGAGTVVIAFLLSGETGTKDVYATVGAALVGVAVAWLVARRHKSNDEAPIPEQNADQEWESG
ncbi:MAG: hypothetical protein GY926_11680 [bacterium]|nr:hypothetical protein [bacterium]